MFYYSCESFVFNIMQASSIYKLWLKLLRLMNDLICLFLLH